MRKTNSNIDKPIYQGKSVAERLADRETYELLLDDYIDGIDVKENESVTDYLKRKGFKGILDDDVISKKVKPKVNGNDGLISLKIFAAITKSAKTGKKVRI